MFSEKCHHKCPFERFTGSDSAAYQSAINTDMIDASVDEEPLLHVNNKLGLVKSHMAYKLN